MINLTTVRQIIQEIVVCMRAERVKKTLMQKEQLIFKNMLKYETDQLKTKPTASFAKSTDTDAKQTITDAKPTVMH